MASDPYKFFRIEAREILEGLNQAILELEKGGAARDPVNRSLRLAHTLKGAARVVKRAEVAELAHAAEGVLSPFREIDGPFPRERCQDLLALVDTMQGHIRALELPPAKPREEAPLAPPDEPLQTLRIGIEDIDTVLDGISESSVSLDALRKTLPPLDDAIGLVKSLAGQLSVLGQGSMGLGVGRACALAERLDGTLEQFHRKLTQAIDRVHRDLDRTVDATRQLRLVPVETIFPSLERTARDAAETLGKSVHFHTEGRDIHVDAHVLGALRDALLQLIRNAVAHGIEMEAGRLAAAKPPSGLVSLRVERRGHRVAFICMDDGAGLDLNSIRQVAQRRNLVSPPERAATLGLEEATRLVFRGGITTTRNITELSGRGIGLDVVRDVTTRLKGELTARTEPGRGTTVEICVPVSMASIATLQVKAGGTIASIPMDAIRGALRVPIEAMANSPGGNVILHEGATIPFFPLAAILRLSAPPPNYEQPFTAVVVEANSARVAIGVDGILGVANVFMKRLPPGIGHVPCVAGASFDEEGVPRLVLDPDGLAAAGHSPLPPPVTAERPRLLVIDDSLTTRMLEQTILETAGYDVDLAISGEEALEMAMNQPYALFIVDVEMPGIDGYEFVHRTRQNPVLSGVPAIIVTSRGSPEDRRRGEEAGARGYIVKSEFDESGLLDLIRQLIRE